MDCKSFMKNLDNYEMLSEDAIEEMKLHAVSCEACRREMDFMLSVMETVKNLPKIEPPADFMDNLNIRIDAEEKKKLRISSRIARNIQHNWKQYTAAAACFALVAVITANSNIFVDKLMKNDDGVISTDTVVTDDGSSASPTDGSADNIVAADVIAADVVTADAAGDNDVIALPSKMTEKTEQSTVSTDKKAAKSSKNEKTVTEKSVSPVSVYVAPASEEQSVAVAQEPAEIKTDAVAAVAAITAEPEQQKEETAKKRSVKAKSDDYGIALSSVSDYEIASYNQPAGRSMPDSESTARGYSLAFEESIAYGSYSKIDRNGNPIEETPKAIGNIKIYAEDAEEAKNVIMQYSHDVNGDLYSTDSASLSMMLSCLNSKGVRYKNYTPAYEGEIQFKLVIG